MDCRNTRPVQFGDLPGDALEFGKSDRRTVAKIDVTAGILGQRDDMMRRVGRDDRARRDRQRPIDAIGAERISAVVEVDGIGPARAATAGHGVVAVTHVINEGVGTAAALSVSLPRPPVMTLSLLSPVSVSS